ncbi:MAG: hypothetical protein ACWGQW_02085 [bacterium]
MATVTAKTTAKKASVQAAATKAAATKSTTTKKATSKASVKPATAPAQKDLILETAHEVETMTKVKALRLVGTLMDDIDHNYFRLGGIFNLIQENPSWYEEKGFDAFFPFVEENYGLKKRKAQYLMQIYRNLVEAKIPWEKIKGLSWSKLISLSRILTTDNVDEWVEKAKDLSKLQLEELISKALEGSLENPSPDTTPPAYVTITFRVHPDQKASIKEAIAKAKVAAETEYDAVALEAICMDYLSGGKKRTPSLKTLMKKQSWEEVIEVFGDVFPDVYVSASDQPEEEEAEEYEEEAEASGEEEYEEEEYEEEEYEEEEEEEAAE